MALVSLQSLQFYEVAEKTQHKYNTLIVNMIVQDSFSNQLY